MKENEENFDWCLGKKVPVFIMYKVGNETCIKEGTVSALDPRQNKGPDEQPRGLFLDGANHTRDHIVKIFTHEGKDVTEHIKMSFGPSL